MKTDNFDEAFRRKVESFHPPFRDDEIDRIQGYVNQHIPLSFWQRFGHTFTYSLGTIIIVSLLTTTLFQANENKTLLNKLSDLNDKLEQKQATIAVNNAPKSIIIEKTDTVYVVKHITKEVSVFDEKTTTLSNESENISDSVRRVLNPSESTQMDIHTKNIEAISDAKKANFKGQGENSSYKTALPFVENTKTIGRVYNKKSTTAKQVENSPNENFRSLEDKSEGKFFTISKNSNQEILPKSEGDFENKSQNITVETLDKSKENFEGNSKEYNAKVLTVNDLKRKVFSPIDLKIVFDLSNRKFNLLHYVATPKQRKLFKFPSIAMPNLKYRVGLGANADFGQIGTSILTDVLFAKRWSITSGVNTAFLGFEHFGDEDDFRRITDKDFRDEHDVKLPLNNSIENIEAHQVLFRVPIYLNYRWPLRRDYTVLFSTGTDLDLHLKQFTSYSHHDLVRDEKHEGIQEKIPVMPFNNWMLSVGIEKRWNHFSVQLSPYFTYQIKQVSYRKEDFAFGFKVNGFYRLSR